MDCKNVGLLNGAPSNNLADTDLDAPEALAVADAFLPDTGCIFGRNCKPRPLTALRWMAAQYLLSAGK